MRAFWEILCKPTPLESNHLQDKELLAGQDYLHLHPVSDTVFFIFTKGIFDNEQIQYASLLIDCYDLADIVPVNKVNFTLQHFQQKDLLKYLYRFRITVAISDQNDNIPIFKQSKYYIKIPEHLSDGSYITEMKAHDLDKEDPDHSKYSRHPQEYEQPFEIDPFNGIITVLHNHLLDREQIEYFYLNILAIDKGNLMTHTQLIIQLIYINDHLPILYNNNNHINIDFLENQKINTFIDFIHLIDLDKDSKNSMIHLLLAILINQLIIDREKIDKFFYRIITYNTDNNMNNIKSINSITYTFTINILDENDNIPLCIYPIYNRIIGDYDPDQNQDLDQDHYDHDPDPNHSIMIHTNTPIYTFVIQIKGYDPDHGLNGTILYQLNPLTNGSQYFYLNESNGKLYTNWFIDSAYDSTMINMDTNPSYDAPIEGIYHIKISLKDMGIPSLSSNETQFFIKIHSFNQSIINSNHKTMTLCCLSTNKKDQYSSKIDNNQSIWPDTNIIHQSINDHLNVNTTINTTYNDPFDYTNHLHTNPICSLPFSYDTGNHSNNNNTNDYYYNNNNQLIGQKYTSFNTSNLSTNHLSSSMNGTLINDHLNHDVYLQSSLHRTIRNSIVYPTNMNSYLSPIYDLRYYDDQCK
ncbi:unnamed protein product [Schistosoma margrebowiei]|uniref:Cadherin domain-containing protein n=1 Tax=Schistosoma margrebowiei TaxID=48269 RepID=A0AA85A044_9TREM|nr:unnamed protein product [Schistosoma margrebowiei]